MTTTDNGVALDDSGEFDAADAFLSRFMPQGDPDAPKKEPSEEKQPTTPKSDDTPEPKSDEAPSEETPEDTPKEEEEEKPAEKKYADSDDTYVKVKVGDEEHEVTVKDLKRLWGQESALTRKSQEVAEARKKAEEETTKAVTSANHLLQRARARLDPYTKIDFLVAAKELSSSDLQALRQEANAAYEEVKFLEQEVGQYVQAAQQQQQQAMATQAKACVAALRDPDSTFHIQDWGDKVYDEMRVFAVSSGLSKDLFNQIVDPAAIKLMHMAMQYSKGQKQVVTTKVNKTPTKIIKSSKSIADKGSNASRVEKAMRNLREGGSTDDAAEAFLAKWAESSD